MRTDTAELPTRQFTLAEAQAICKRHQYLQGHILQETTGYTEIIETVTVAPHDSFNQWFFFNYYIESGDKDDALAHFKCAYYSVLAIIITVREPQFEISYTYKPLAAIITLNELTYEITGTNQYRQ